MSRGYHFLLHKIAEESRFDAEAEGRKHPIGICFKIM
jgi:hypothetical protein